MQRPDSDSHPSSTTWRERPEPLWNLELQMKTRKCIRMSASVAALIVATTLTAMPSNASTPSSPAERAATAELNRNITVTNTAAEDQYRLRMAQYQAQLRQNE